MNQQSDSIFAPLNQFFDQIYVLSLPRAKDRQASVEENLKGLNWRFFWGTDKNDLDPNTVYEDGTYDDAVHKQTKRTHRSMTMAEIACALSHRRIMQDAIDNGYQRILIFEDDVIPCKQTLSHFEEYLQELPQDWDLFLLGYYDEKRPTVMNKLKRVLYKVFKSLHISNWQDFDSTLFPYLVMSDYSEHFYRFGKLVGAHAYAINLATAKKYVAYQTPIKVQSDRVFMSYYLVEPLKAFVAKRPFFNLSELSKDTFIQHNSER